MIRPLGNRFCALLIILIGTCAYAGIRPSFMLDYSSWHATDIVVVTPLAGDGSFQVLESWKGGLRPGTIITVPELAPEADAVPISRYPQQPFSDDRKVSTKVPLILPGGKIVLYLKDNAPASEDTTKLSRWAASSLPSDMKASAVWINDGFAYGFVQIMNPGPSVLVQLRNVSEANASGIRMDTVSEASLKEETFSVLRLQQQIEGVVRIDDLKARAEALRSYADSKVLPAKMFVLDELGKCGERALPTIGSMLDDPKFSKDAGQLVEQYAKVGGAFAGPELASRLDTDLRYWQATGPTLPVGWWNIIDKDGSLWAETRGYRDRYSQTRMLILSLDKLQYLPAPATAIQFRDFWKSLPQLNDPSGLNRTADEANQLVQHLRSK